MPVADIGLVYLARRAAQEAVGHRGLTDHPWICWVVECYGLALNYYFVVPWEMPEGCCGNCHLVDYYLRRAGIRIVLLVVQAGSVLAHAHYRHSWDCLLAGRTVHLVDLALMSGHQDVAVWLEGP